MTVRKSEGNAVHSAPSKKPGGGDVSNPVTLLEEELETIDDDDDRDLIQAKDCTSTTVRAFRIGIHERDS